MWSFSEHRNWRIIGLAAAAVAALLLVFCLGLAVGAQGLRPAGFDLLRGLRFPAGARGERGHGAVGIVTSISADALTITDRNSQTTRITVNSNTLIEQERGRRIAFRDIHLGDRILVLGSPQNGAIQARFIRVQRGGPARTPTPGLTPAATPGIIGEAGPAACSENL